MTHPGPRCWRTDVETVKKGLGLLPAWEIDVNLLIDDFLLRVHFPGCPPPPRSSSPSSSHLHTRRCRRAAPLLLALSSKCGQRRDSLSYTRWVCRTTASHPVPRIDYQWPSSDRPAPCLALCCYWQATPSGESSQNFLQLLFSTALNRLDTPGPFLRAAAPPPPHSPQPPVLPQQQYVCRVGSPMGQEAAT